MVKSKISQPPRLARRLLALMSEYSNHFSSIGDFDEIHGKMLQAEGRSRADRWYWSQVLGSLFPYLVLVVQWRFVMFGNYIKITWRNIGRHKGYSFINIAGLIIGLSAFLLIFLYIRYELSYDRFHRNARDIYRVYLHQRGNVWQGSDLYNSGPPALAGALVVPLRDFDVKYWDWSNLDNPPILHRKETLVLPEYPGRDKFERLTRQEERAGLYESTERIGNYLEWNRLLESKGLGVRGHRLVRG